MKKNILILIFVIIFVSISFLYFNKEKEIKIVKIAGQDIKVDLAITQQQEEKGLSGREGLAEDKGMLFIFERPFVYGFWMKDMLFPIDIIWINEHQQVVYIKENASPEAYPEIYTPKENAKYVLEVKTGFARKNNLKIGDTVLFTY